MLLPATPCRYESAARQCGQGPNHPVDIVKASSATVARANGVAAIVGLGDGCHSRGPCPRVGVSGLTPRNATAPTRYLKALPGTHPVVNQARRAVPARNHSPSFGSSAKSPSIV
jgi:hypothetical protein